MPFYSEEQEREYQDDLFMDSLSQGAYMSLALRQYAGAYGQETPDKEWILTPYDTWEKNPYFNGTPGRHPEDDYYDEEEQVVATPIYNSIAPAMTWNDGEEIPF